MNSMVRPFGALLFLAALVCSCAQPAREGVDCDARAGERRRAIQERGQIFHRIAVDRQQEGEHVVYRDDEVTAFVDLTDPRHPRYDPTRGPSEGPGGASQIHLLIVPNAPREHVGTTLGARIHGSDLRAALAVIEAGERLVEQLGIRDAEIFFNAESRIGVGYLHAHLVGQLSPDAESPRAASP